MSENKSGPSFLQKMVSFVANPNKDWGDIAADSGEARASEFAKSEIKQMIERKRRNDFVRKREFDHLRRLRRQGLTPEQLAVLGTSSAEDSGLTGPDTNVRTEVGGDITQKIKEIEEQMLRPEGSHSGQTHISRPSDLSHAPTRPMDLPRAEPAPAPSGGPRELPPLQFNDADDVDLGGQVEDHSEDAPKAAPAVAHAQPGSAATAASALARAAPVQPPPPASAPQAHRTAPAPIELNARVFENPLARETAEVILDPELDDAVMAFANADFDHTEATLQRLLIPNGLRTDHPETWLVLFDLYRAIGQQHRFEALSEEYAQSFGFSPPQWISLPKQLAAAAHADDRQRSSAGDIRVGWVCPEVLDPEAVSKLSGLVLQLPLPWIFDWSGLKAVHIDAAGQLLKLFQTWLPQKLDIRWMGGNHFFEVLGDLSPTGARDADPMFWRLRLEALRMAHRPDQFDEVAIDYCITYEISPPSWEPSVCQVRISETGSSAQASSISRMTTADTGFVESMLLDDPSGETVASVELNGQLVGDISKLLQALSLQLGHAGHIKVNCSRLIRVDFLAAGDLLNWVIERNHEGRIVEFHDAHRLVALFFAAMGITGEAKVMVRVN